MSWLTLQHNQTITHWSRTGLDSAGDLEFAAAVEIVGRWETTNELFISANGEERRSRAIIYLTQDVKEGDYLMLGELESGDEDDPLKNHNAYMVQAFQKVPNYSADDFERVAYL